MIGDRRAAARAPLAAKVPAVNASFWLIKLLTTATGEAAADYLAQVNILLAATVGLLGFVFAMRWQFRARTYIPSVYWFAVLMVAVFGTMGADAMHILFGIPYLASTILCGAALVVIFRRWRRTEGTLSIHSIVTRRREGFYWLAVLATFAMGTAVGDLSATTFGLGFAGAVVLFAVLITVPALAWWRFGLNAVAAFWTAYVLTRPLGASIADWLGKPPSFGRGLGYGDGTVAAGGVVAIVAAVIWVAVRRTGIQAPQPAEAFAARTTERLLYFFTSRDELERIRAAGAVEPRSLRGPDGLLRHSPPVVWLTDDPDPLPAQRIREPGASVHDRRTVRLTVAVSNAMPWFAWAHVQRLPRRVRRRIDHPYHGFAARWWVTPQPIPEQRWLSIDQQSVPGSRMSTLPEDGSPGAPGAGPLPATRPWSRGG